MYKNQKRIKKERQIRKRAEKILEETIGHFWDVSYPSPSGKMGYKCRFCGRYSNAPCKAVYGPCQFLLEVLNNVKKILI